MRVKEILSYIPKETLEFLALETNVDYKTKKLDGIVFFQLILYSMLQVKRNSLRVMESIFSSYHFQSLCNDIKGESIKYNSISDRLSTINPDFFEKIFQACVVRFNKQFDDKFAEILRFDSTLVSFSAKLLNIGFMSGGNQEHVKQLKFTIGYSTIPEYVSFHHEAQYNSENVALKEAILNCSQSKKRIVVFDRGIQARETYDKLNKAGILFITRINPDSRCKVLKAFEIHQQENSPSVVIIKDCQVQLYNRKNWTTKTFIRLIHGKKKDTGEELTFITNIQELTAIEVTEIYKARWEIEVFFKFIKQELNFSHLINRKPNGIKVILYITMILAILLTVYKYYNKLKGYKIPKIKFAFELEEELIKQIVLISGGDPDKITIDKGFW